VEFSKLILKAVEPGLLFCHERKHECERLVPKNHAMSTHDSASSIPNVNEAADQYRE
jgi:hypothetical protein